jgi:hypothetical protein
MLRSIILLTKTLVPVKLLSNEERLFVVGAPLLSIGLNMCRGGGTQPRGSETRFVLVLPYTNSRHKPFNLPSN